MMIPGKMTPCQSREAVVTVLSYCNGTMDGYLQHPRLYGREKIQSLSFARSANNREKGEFLSLPAAGLYAKKTATKELHPRWCTPSCGLVV